MTKCFFIVLFLSSVMALSITSCSEKKQSIKTKEALRFEQMLTEAKLTNKDSIRYLVWNTNSCGGCRTGTVRLLQNDSSHNIKLIVPLHFAGVVSTVNTTKLFVDTAGIFDKFYFGVDNIGIVRVYNNQVISIKNYNPEAMDSLAIDWVK